MNSKKTLKGKLDLIKKKIKHKWKVEEILELLEINNKNDNSTKKLNEIETNNINNSYCLGTVISNINDIDNNNTNGSIKIDSKTKDNIYLSYISKTNQNNKSFININKDNKIKNLFEEDLKKLKENLNETNNNICLLNRNENKHNYYGLPEKIIFMIILIIKIII